MAYQINGTNIPATIYTSGRITPLTNESLGDDGTGLTIESRVKKLKWTWPIMTKADFEWWTQTILTNKLSLRCSVRIPDETMTETAYTTAIVRKPVPDHFKGGNYYDITMGIEVIP